MRREVAVQFKWIADLQAQLDVALSELKRLKEGKEVSTLYPSANGCWQSVPRPFFPISRAASGKTLSRCYRRRARAAAGTRTRRAKQQEVRPR
jgi:hypothetical protein